MNAAAYGDLGHASDLLRCNDTVNCINMRTNSDLSYAAEFVESAALSGWFDADEGVLLLRTGLADELLVSSLCAEAGSSDADQFYGIDLQGAAHCN